MKNKKNILLSASFITLILLLFITTFGGCRVSETKKEYTENKELKWQEEHLTKNLSTIANNKTHVHFISNGAYGLNLKEKPWWGTDFKLKKNEKFFSSPDHHAFSEYEVLDFDKNGVSIKYISSFNHLSFGKNLITSDSGVVYLKYK